MVETLTLSPWLEVETVSQQKLNCRTVDVDFLCWSGQMSSYKVRNVESIIAKKQLIWLVHGSETTTQWILHVLVLVLLDLLRCAF